MEQRKQLGEFYDTLESLQNFFPETLATEHSQDEVISREYITTVESSRKQRKPEEKRKCLETLKTASEASDHTIENFLEEMNGDKQLRIIPQATEHNEFKLLQPNFQKFEEAQAQKWVSSYNRERL